MDDHGLGRGRRGDQGGEQEEKAFQHRESSPGKARRLHAAARERLTREKPGALRAPGFPSLPEGAAFLPEEVVDHVDHLAGIDVDQEDVVIIADPLGAVGRRRQAVLERIDPVAAEEQLVEDEADAQRL
jgi:hypothetical protein